MATVGWVTEDDVPMGMMLHTVHASLFFQKPDFALRIMVLMEGVVERVSRTLSLLRTKLMMTASFSRPCIPSTVPISSSGPYTGLSKEARRVTCA